MTDPIPSEIRKETVAEAFERGQRLMRSKAGSIAKAGVNRGILDASIAAYIWKEPIAPYTPASSVSPASTKEEK